MIPIGTLTPAAVRDIYLRGINLGASWTGAGGDAAISALLNLEVSRAEALMGIHFRRWRVLTLPAAGLVQGQDYDQLGLLVPYTAPEPDQEFYALTLHWHDVQAVTRVRLFEGYTTAVPPAPVFETMSQALLAFSSYHETLYVPVTLPRNPTLAQGWAVDYLFGLGVLPPEVIQWASIGAAIQVLGMGGAAADVSSGIAGGSFRMDGTEERTNYLGQSQWMGGGLYAGPIKMLTLQRDDIDLAKLRFRYQNTLGDGTAIPADAVRPRQPYEQTPCLPRIPPL